MPKLKLKLASDIGVNSETNAVEFNMSSKEGNTLVFNEDGLYADSSNGSDGSGGTGYITTGDYNGVRIGYAYPYGNKEADRRVVLKSIVHRVYTADDNDIYSLKGFRPEIDYVLPGDMVIYNNKLYIVTQVTTQGSDGTAGTPGNKIASFVGPLNET